MTAILADSHFRSVVSHFGSGIVVVTGTDEAEPVGFTCQSFFSLSLTPRLIAFAVGRHSSTWSRISTTGRCTINVLSAEQKAIARQFAVSGASKFSDVLWSPGVTDAPRLHDALAWLDCQVVDTHDGGDHWLVVAEVIALESAEASEPLIYYRSGFGGFSA